MLWQKVAHLDLKVAICLLEKIVYPWNRDPQICELCLPIIIMAIKLLLVMERATLKWARGLHEFEREEKEDMLHFIMKCS